MADAVSPPGTVVLVRRGVKYLLLVGARQLHRGRVRIRAQKVHMPGPPGSSGRWLWTYQSPDRFVLLGEWKEELAECSLPVAVIRASAGWSVLTGSSSPADAPESIALGWTGSGHPVVAVEGGPCNGVTKPRIGVYVVPSLGWPTGHPDRIPTPVGSYAFRMWGPD